MKSRVLPYFNAFFDPFTSQIAPWLASWVIAYIDLHLFITAVSIPVLSYWGMPVSLLTIVGNFLFAPLCSLFLWLSAIIYSTELLHIPNQYVIDMLDMLRRFWEYCLNFGSSGWLVAFRHHHMLVTVLFMVLPFILLYALAHNRTMRMGVFCLWICFLYALNMINTQAYFLVKTERGEFHCAAHKNKIIMVDPGVLLKSAHPEHFFAYQLGPALAKRTGSTVIDYYVLLKPSIRSFQSLIHAFEKVKIRTLIVPLWQGTASKKMWYYFFKLKKGLTENGCQLLRIGNHEKKISIDGKLLIIQPLETKVTIGTHWCAHYTVLLKTAFDAQVIYNPDKV